MPSARWQVTQCSKRMGATSRLKVTGSWAGASAVVTENAARSDTASTACGDSDVSTWNGEARSLRKRSPAGRPTAVMAPPAWNADLWSASRCATAQRTAPSRSAGWFSLSVHRNGPDVPGPASPQADDGTSSAGLRPAVPTGGRRSKPLRRLHDRRGVQEDPIMGLLPVGVRLTRRVRKEYRVHFDRNPTQSAAKRGGSAGMNGRLNAALVWHRPLSARFGTYPLAGGRRKRSRRRPRFTPSGRSACGRGTPRSPSRPPR